MRRTRSTVQEIRPPREYDADEGDRLIDYIRERHGQERFAADLLWQLEAAKAIEPTIRAGNGQFQTYRKPVPGQKSVSGSPSEKQALAAVRKLLSALAERGKLEFGKHDAHMLYRLPSSR